MSFQVPSRDELAQEFVEQHALALPEIDSSRGSETWVRGRVVSGVAWSIISKGVALERNLLPDQCDEETLLRWATLLDIPREGAAPSQGASALRVDGVAGSSVTNGAELAHGDGTLYRVTSVGAVVGVGGHVDVNVAAISVGAPTNKIAGETLLFTSPLPGVQPQATLIADLTGGLDLESIGRWRGRIIENLAEPPEGGAVHDYAQWAKAALSSITDVYVYQHRRGRGTIDVAVLQDGSGADRIIADVSPVVTAFAAKRPAGVRDVLVLDVQASTVDVTAKVQIDGSRFGWDWDDSGVGTPVAAVNAGAKQITATGLPAGAVVGKRIQILGEQRTITARTGDTVTVDSWFVFSPASYRVYSGGDLVSPVQAAIRSVFRSVGPARGNYPAGAEWNDSIKVYLLISAIAGVDGVEDVEITAPVANSTPADFRGAEILLNVPGAILVVRM